MKLYPGATFRPLKENTTEPFVKKTQLIFHSAVSGSDSLFSYFNRDDVKVESHLYVQADGDAEQYIGADRQADANFKANVRALSVETWDDRDPDHIPWTHEQILRLADIAAWAYLTHGVPLVRAPDWDAPGMGGHTDYREWSNVRGKTCPGVARKPQIDSIIAMGLQIVSGKKLLLGKPGPIKTTPIRPPDTSVLVVDGDFGTKTIKALQRELGVKDDGVWGPQSRIALQNRLAVRPDGNVGPETIRALQKRVGSVGDGEWGPNTVKALQRKLNTGTL